MRTILVVDDETEVRELIVETIKSSFDCEILEASNPMIALDVFNQNSGAIDCVVTDFYMPIENGASLCQIITKDHPGLKIILFTGDHSIKKRLTGSEHINVILYKPEGLEELVEHLKLV